MAVEVWWCLKGNCMLSTQNIGEKCRIPFNVISNLHCIDVRLMSDAQTPTHTAHPFLSSLVQCHLVGPNFSLTVYKMHFCVVCYPWLWQFTYVCSARTNNVRVHVAFSLCLSSSQFWHFHAIHASLRSVRLNSKQSTSFSLNNCGKCAHHVQLMVVCVWRIYAWHYLAI